MFTCTILVTITLVALIQSRIIHFASEELKSHSLPTCNSFAIHKRWLATLLAFSMLCTSRGNLFRAGRILSGARTIQTRFPTTPSFISLRSYAATRPPASVKGAPRPSPNIAQPRRTPPRPNTYGIDEIRRLRKIDLAEQLYKSGDKLLYQSTNRTTRFRLTSWGLSFLCGAGIFYFWQNNLLDLEYFKAIGHDHPNLVLFAFATTSIFLGAALGWAFKKSMNNVDRLDLVQKSGAVFVQITVRRPVPFLKRSFVVRPQDVVVDDRVVAMMSIPESLLASAPSESSPSAFTWGVIRESLRSVSRFFYNIFDSARVFFSQEGIISIDVSTQKGDKTKVERYFMDAGGLYFHHEEKKIALWELVEARDPYAES